MPPADPSLSAFNLLDAAGYEAAIGQPVAIVEDDGGRPDGYGNHISQARVATVNGNVWEITLKSGSSETAAMAEFKQRSSAGDTTPLAGVGDEAVSSTSLGIVRKGAQLLVISGGYFTDALNAQLSAIKEAGGDSTALLGDVIGETNQLIAPLAAKVAGTAATSPAVTLPAGSIDPCLPGVDVPAMIESVFGVTDVQASYQSSQKPPGLSCLFQASGLPFGIEVNTVTDTQLAASVNSTSADARFQADAAGHSDDSTSADVAVSPGGQFTEVMADDPFRWLLDIDFPGQSLKCLTDDQQAKAEQFIDDLIRGAGTQPPVTDADMQAARTAAFNSLADHYQALADEARAKAAQSCH